MNSKHSSGKKNTSYKRFARKFLHIVQLHHNVINAAWLLYYNLAVLLVHKNDDQSFFPI